MKLKLKHLLSNALKNFAPLAFLVPGVGPGLAAGIGGLGSALGQGLSRHPNLGAALKQGVVGAGEAYTGAKLAGGHGYKGVMSGVKSAFAPSSAPSVTSAAPAANANAPGSFNAIASKVAGEAAPGVPMSATATAPSFMGRLGSFAEKNPTAIGMGLQGLGSMQTADSTNAANRESARRTAAETETLEAERKRKAAQDAALEPLRRALAGQLGTLGQGGYKPAPNPYLPGGGTASNPYFA